MLVKVAKDMRVVLIFYFFILYLFGLIFMVIGAGNHSVPGKFKDAYLEQEASGEGIELPNMEYEKMGMFFGNIIQTFRNSVGDFDFEASTYLTPGENILFFCMWTIVVFMTMIIFLNFIISEISASYEKYQHDLDNLVLQERTGLIEEAEFMMPVKKKNIRTFPKVIIKRAVDN